MPALRNEDYGMEKAIRNTLVALVLFFIILAIGLGYIVFSDPPKSWIEEGERRREEKARQIEKYKELGIPRSVYQEYEEKK